MNQDNTMLEDAAERARLRSLGLTEAELSIIDSLERRAEHSQRPVYDILETMTRNRR